MSLRAKLTAGFCAVAAITLAIALLGYWQVSRLGTALYEVGVVRLPSLEGLGMLSSAPIIGAVAACHRARVPAGAREITAMTR